MESKISYLSHVRVPCSIISVPSMMGKTRRENSITYAVVENLFPPVWISVLKELIDLTVASPNPESFIFDGPRCEDPSN